VTAWIKIGLRNLIKHRRRSVVTLMAIALGFAAVNLFSGFTQYMYIGNREVAIFAKCQGHLVVFKKGFLEKGQMDPGRYLLSPEELESIAKICRKDPRVILATPQLTLSGLLTNGLLSTIFVAQGIVPSVVDAFWNGSRLPAFIDLYEGKKLEEDKPYGVALTHGLARLLNLEIGSGAVALTTTIEGQMNALDVEVFQLFDTDFDELNDKVMRIPFDLAQSLYDTKGADRMAVLLRRTEETKTVRSQLQASFESQGLDVDMKTWEELSPWYRKVKEMFDVIFLFLFLVVFVIVVISVVNTMSMAVFERTREIGTLRALGLKRRGVLLLFGIESTLLGLGGTFLGFLLTLLGRWAIDALRPTWTPPGLTREVPILIDLEPERMLYSFLFLIILCWISSFIPARRAARQNVVDALGHT